MTQLIDTHCHLEFPGLKERLNEVLANMATNRVIAAVSIGTTLERAREVLEIAEAHPNIWATVGVHPDNEGVEEPTVDRLVALANHAKVVAIGETGLDYYRLTDAPEWQRTRFRTHIQAARTLKLPLVIHTRAAAHDTIAILREEGAEAVGGVMHCFTESRETAKAALDLGFYISFSGIATFKNAASVREVARYVPLDRILVETDAPYLAPPPHRGRRNEPGFVAHTARAGAKALGIEPAEFAALTTANFNRLFTRATA